MSQVPAVSPLEWTTVHSTLPVFPAIHLREPVITTNLILRPFRTTDIGALHSLRSDPAVMALWIGSDNATHAIEESRAELAQALDPSRYIFAICDRAGRFIGTGGSHKRQGSLGWPVLCYSFRSDVWGQGLGTEFLRAFLPMYFSLPRVPAEIRVEKSTAFRNEQITSTTTARNIGSQRVMQKSGMTLVKVWEDNHTMHGYSYPA